MSYFVKVASHGVIKFMVVVVIWDILVETDQENSFIVDSIFVGLVGSFSFL